MEICPNCPDVPVPQHSTLPFDVVAHVCSRPAETEVALTFAGISAGAGLPVEAVLPVPSWPSALLPQHQTLPSAPTAHAWSAPASRDMGRKSSGSPVTSPAVWALLPVVVRPSWPLSLSPQQYMSLAGDTAHPNESPMASMAESPTAGRSTRSSSESHVPSRSKSSGADEASPGSVPQRSSSYPVKPSPSTSSSNPFPANPHALKTHRSSLAPTCAAIHVRP